MIDFVENYFSQFDFLGAEEIEIFKKNIEITQWNAGDLIQEEGKVQSRVAFILTGIVRFYQVDESGIDKTIWIADEGMHIGDPVSVFEKVSSDINIKAIENCLIASFNTVELDKLELEYPRLLLHKTYTLKEGICEVWNRMRFFATMSPEQRYIFLTKNRPTLFDRVQQKHLASYIGVTEVSMSRIKKRSESK